MVRLRYPCLRNLLSKVVDEFFFFFFFFQLIARLINVETLFSRVSPFVRRVSSTSQHEVGDFCRGSSRYRYVRAFTFKVLIMLVFMYLSLSVEKEVGRTWKYFEDGQEDQLK